MMTRTGPNGLSPAKPDDHPEETFVPDVAAIKKRLAVLPVSTFEAGEAVIVDGQTTGKLLLLRKGLVEVVKEGRPLARISEPGAIFGELAVLLDRPHSADVKALERSEFNVVDARTLLGSDATSTLYVAALLAGRLDAANVALIELKRQLEVSNPNVAVVQTVDQITRLLTVVETTTAHASSSPQYPRPRPNVGQGAPRFLPDTATIERSLAILPVSTYEPGEIAIKDGETSAKLLFLRKGAVEVFKEGRQIARISEPGAIFGELAILLDRPHSADVRVVEYSEFSVADARTLLASNSMITLYVAASLAGRLDAANVALGELKRQLEASTPGAAVVQTIDKIAELLSNESFAEDVFLDELIPKPWGREYRIYADNFYDIWKLELGPRRATSLHYHPRKDTILMCLGGRGRVQLGDDSIEILAGKHILIGRGVVHATTNLGEDRLELIEVEHPRNKFDLIRVGDSYGRAHQPYEATSAAAKNLPGLVKYDGIPGAKYRPADIDGHYRFTIGGLHVESSDSFVVAVPVGVQSVTGGIEILGEGSPIEMGRHGTEVCFQISVGS
jgi:CRP-like cAMP-binding protein/mannose-6-phosphate isomerase-like protein (cupin superfamily)